VTAIVAIRDFAPADAAEVNRVALAAWGEYAAVFNAWPRTARLLGSLAALAGELELIVGEVDGQLAGAVGYVAPFAAREAAFPPDWALIRLLSVAPAARGHGLGRRLSEECIGRARRDRAAAIGLHTSPVMQVALPLYRRLGFRYERALPDRNGVPYALYALRL
jgi:ribosomal protein S18 acetylase RimI-like enzyme